MRAKGAALVLALFVLGVLVAVVGASDEPDRLGRLQRFMLTRAALG